MIVLKVLVLAAGIVIVLATFASAMRTVVIPRDIPARLTRAVFLAIDRHDLINKALEGAGVPCAVLDPKLYGEYALPLEEVAKLPGCRQPKDADLAEARRLVEKHSPNGVDVEAAVRSVGNYIDRAQLILAQLRRIGIRGTLKTYESAAAYLDRTGHSGRTIVGLEPRQTPVPLAPLTRRQEPAAACPKPNKRLIC